MTTLHTEIPADLSDEKVQNELLKLDNQLCFAFYVCSKEIIRKYKPYLEPLRLTYTGYIVMLALWEQDHLTVKELGKRLTLDSGTLTPLLKKLESLAYIERQRCRKDERTVHILLTEQGRALKKKAAAIPVKMLACTNLPPDQALQLLHTLHDLRNRILKEPSPTADTEKKSEL